MPFAGYEDFSTCVSDNSDKSNPEAYCAVVHERATGEWPAEKEGIERCVVLKELEAKVLLRYAKYLDSGKDVSLEEVYDEVLEEL